MKEISRQTVAALQKDLDAAIKPLLEKYGLKLKSNRGRYDAYSVKVSLELLLDGAEQDRAAAKHDGYLTARFGLKVGDTVVRIDGTKKYTITGATERSEKYDLTGKTDDGKEWRFSHRGLNKADGTLVVDAWAPKPTITSRPVTPSTEVR